MQKFLHSYFCVFTCKPLGRMNQKSGEKNSTSESYQNLNSERTKRLETFNETFTDLGNFDLLIFKSSFILERLHKIFTWNRVAFQEYVSQLLIRSQFCF